MEGKMADKIILPSFMDTIEAELNKDDANLAWKNFKQQDSSNVVRGLYVKAVATHADKIINGRIYVRDRVAAGSQTFIKPFPKPVSKQHSDADPIGRVIEQKFIDTIDLLGPKFYSFKQLTSKVHRDKYIDFLADNVLFKDNNLGTGYIELGMDITDKEAIEKVMDERYLTMSIEFDTDHYYCSACYADWKAGEVCEHRPGQVVEERPVFNITDKLIYKGIDFVNKPADDGSIVIHKGEKPAHVDAYVLRTYEDKMTYFKDHLEDFSMFKQLLEGLKAGEKISIDSLWEAEDFNSYELYKFLGIDEKHQLTEEGYAALPKSKYCGFGNSLPIVDSVHFNAIKEFLKLFGPSDGVSKVRNRAYYEAQKLGLLPSSEVTIELATGADNANETWSIKSNDDVAKLCHKLWETNIDSEIPEQVKQRMLILNLDAEELKNQFVEQKAAQDSAEVEETKTEEETKEEIKEEIQEQADSAEPKDDTEQKKETSVNDLYTIFTSLGEDQQCEFRSLIGMDSNIVQLEDKIGALQAELEKTNKELEVLKAEYENKTKEILDYHSALASAVVDLRMISRKPETTKDNYSRETATKEFAGRTKSSLIDSLKDLRSELFDPSDEGAPEETGKDAVVAKVKEGLGNAVDQSEFFKIFRQRNY